MGATKQDKLDSLATRPASAVFRVPPVPNVSELVTTYGLKEGLRRYQDAQFAWARDLEKAINERIVVTPTVAAGPPT